MTDTPLTRMKLRNTESKKAKLKYVYCMTPFI